MRAFCTISLLAVSLLPLCLGYRLPSAPLFLRRNAIGSATHLKALPTVGEVVVAEVDDIGGSFDNPTVTFSIRKDGDVVKGKMSTKGLSPTERLALQAGSVMEVRVMKADGSAYEVALPGALAETAKNAERNDRQSTNRSFKKPSITPAPSQQVQTEPPGLTLNGLKIGMKIDGTVINSTPYAVFIAASIYRPGKGGRYVEVNGMLHRNDMSKELRSKNKSGSMMANGTPVTAYVKEIFKNSGRFTLTSDGSIDKAKVIEQKINTKEEGSERRRARRLRIQMENVSAGDTVKGYVMDVIPDGILVSISSLGPVNVTGLINKKDLPVQFQVPADMKQNFQMQLLKQDFTVGREVVSGVMKLVEGQFSKPYDLILSFEGFSSPMEDTFSVEEVRSEEELSKKGGNDDEDDVDDSEFLSDIQDIYDELRGESKLLAIQNVRDWEDIQDMLASGSLSKEELEETLIEVVGKGAKFMDLAQFQEVIEVIQSLMDDDQFDTFEDDDDEDEDEDEDNDEDEEQVSDMAQADVIVAKSESGADAELAELKTEAREVYDELRSNSKLLSVDDFIAWQDVNEMIAEGHITKHMLSSTIQKVNNGKDTLTFEQFFELIALLDGDSLSDEKESQSSPSPPKVSSKDKQSIKDREETFDKQYKAAKNDDDEDIASIFEESMKEVAKELYDELRGKSTKLTVAAFKSWSDIKDMLKNDFLDMATIDNVIRSVKKGDESDLLTFKEFFAIIDALENEIGPGEEDSKITPPSKGFTRTAENVDDDDEDEEIDDDVVEVDEDELDEVLMEFYESLKNQKGAVTVKAFKSWEDVVEMISSGALKEETLDELLASVLESTKASTVIEFEQFCDIVEMIDEVIGLEGSTEDGDDDEDVIGTTGNTDDEEDELSEEEYNAEIFEELTKDGKTVSVKDFLAWDEVQELLSEGYLDQASLNALLSEVGVTINGKLTLDQFSQLTELVNEVTAASTNEEDDGETDEEDEEEDEDETNLPNTSSGISAETVSASLDEREASRAALALSKLNSEDFEVGEEEDMSFQEMYDELKGQEKQLSVASFKKWEDVQEMIMRGLVSEKMVDTFIKSVVKGKTMSLAEFEELVLLIEEAADATEEALEESDSSSSNDASSDMSIDWKSKSNGVDEKDGDGEEGEEEDGEDISEEDLEEMAKTIFEDLKGATNKKLSVKRFRAWDGVKEEIKSGALSKSDVDRALKSVGAHKSEELDFNQFKVVMDMLEAIIEENSARLGGKSLADSIEEELSNSLAGVPAGKGFGTRSTATSSKAPAEDTSEEEMITREIFDDLRGKDKLLKLDKLREWAELQEMIESGALKRSTLEKALVKVGCYESKTLDLNQFSQLLDIVQAAVDPSALDLGELDKYSSDDNRGFKSSSNAKVLDVPAKDKSVEKSVEEDFDEDDVESSFGVMEIDEEEAAMEVYEELKGASDKVTLKDFLQWDDLQDLLDNDALNRDDLAKAIEQSGLNVDQDENSAIDFQTFYDLLQLVEAYIDQEKVGGPEDLVLERSFTVDEDTDPAEVMEFVDEAFSTADKLNKATGKIGKDDMKVSYVDGFGNRSEGKDAMAAMQSDMKRKEQAKMESDAEVDEMFEDLSNGKDFITEKKLRKWDELQELVDADLVSAETIDDYIKRLNLKNDRIDINTFRKFMDMLDTVLVDEEGNLLGFDEADKAVNLDDLDDEDDDN